MRYYKKSNLKGRRKHLRAFLKFSLLLDAQVICLVHLATPQRYTSRPASKALVCY